MVLARVNAPVYVSWEAVLPRLSALHPIRRDGDGGFFYAQDSTPMERVTEKTEKEAAHGRHS